MLREAEFIHIILMSIFSSLCTNNMYTFNICYLVGLENKLSSARRFHIWDYKTVF